MSVAYLDPAAVKHLVVHCSATKPTMDWGVHDIDRAHRLRGFLKVGYHYVIRRNGAIEKGRADNERGAHAEGHNSSSLGICLVGGLDASGRSADNFTDRQKEALYGLLGVLTQTFPQAEVLGHRDLPGVKKACPCFDVRGWWANYRGG